MGLEVGTKVYEHWVLVDLDGLAVKELRTTKKPPLLDR